MTSEIEVLADIVRRHAAGHGDRPMLTFGGRTRTYADMDLRSNQAAQALAAAGVGAGDRVAYLGKNTPEYVELLFGAAKLDATTVAVNWRLAGPEIAQVLDDAMPEVLLVEPDWVVDIEKIEPELAVTPTVVVLGEHPRWLSYDRWAAAHPPVDPGARGSATSVAFQMYTSGTTGAPKGVMLTNENLSSMVTNASPSWGFRAEMVVLGAMPAFHISGTGWFVAAMAHGAHVVLLREVDPDAIIRAVAEHHVTHALFVPAVLQLLLATPGVREADLSSLELILYGGSPITDTVLTEAISTFGCDFVQAYGLTETCGAAIQLAAGDHDPVHRPELLRSCGHPLPGVELRVVDPERGTDVAHGEVGEVWLRGPQVTPGYWGKPDETAAAITPEGWFRSGDAGYLEGGYLYLHDRVKDMIISGGENVYPAEVENVLMQHPGVDDVAVIGVPDERWGETVKAVVVGDVDPAELLAFCRDRLAHYKCPTSVDLVDALPRNPSGKVLKRDLRAPYWAPRGGARA